MAIETSCDETAICLLEAEGGLDSPRFTILGNALLSQIDLHKEFGGVVPMLAKREHEKNLPILLDKVLKEAGDPKIDYIAVTSGPGLEPALWTGITFAENLGKTRSIPVLPVNHMEGHIYSPLFEAGSQIEFPALALLVSGGHTEIVSIRDFGSYEILGKTRDDAVGEAFDKVARLLGLPYPGGPEISKLAEIARQNLVKPRFTLPRPMINSSDLDFSFSGLETSVLYTLKGLEITPTVQSEMALEFENAAVEVLIEKTRKALEAGSAKTLIVAGGVSQNKHLRAELWKLAESFSGLSLLLPTPSLTTDNAVMIGMAAYVRLLKNGATNSSEPIRAQGNLSLS